MFDVSERGELFYGKGMTYAALAGKDMTHALAQLSPAFLQNRSTMVYVHFLFFCFVLHKFLMTHLILFSDCTLSIREAKLKANGNTTEGKFSVTISKLISTLPVVTHDTASSHLEAMSEDQRKRVNQWDRYFRFKYPIIGYL